MRFEEKFQLGSARLKDWDYSQDGFYFVTICSHDRANIFGEIQNNKMVLNESGRVTEKCWREIPDHFLNAKLDKFVMMPNHVHGIVVIDNLDNSREKSTISCCRNAINRVSTNNTNNQKSGGITGDSNPMGKKSLGEIIRWFKGKCSFKIHQTAPALDRIWQNSFFDHIVRNDEELNRVRDYIVLNPRNWNEDSENLRPG